MEDKSLLELINDNLFVLNSTFEETEDKVKAFEKIVCPFYKGHENCIGCTKSLSQLEECAAEYSEMIIHRPMKNWHPSFTAIQQREVVEINSLNTMLCDTCYFADNCAYKKPKSTCVIKWGGDIHSLSPKQQFDRLIQIQEERIMVARTAELVDGGIPDQNLSNEIDRLVGLVQSKANLDVSSFKLSIEGESRGPGQGILAQLFGGAKKETPTAIENNKPETIDITAEEVEKIKNPEFTEAIVEEKTKRRRKTD